MFNNRFNAGTDWGAIGERFMGKTHTLHEVMARDIKKEKQEGNKLFVLYVDTMGDTSRYRYFDNYRRVSNIKEIPQYVEKGEYLFILDLHTGGSFRNYMSKTYTYSDVLADMILLFEHIKAQYPTLKFFLFLNEANLFFPNVTYNGDKSLYKPQAYILKQGKHFNLVIYWCSPDTQGISKLLIKEAGQILCFRISESNSLSYIAEQMAGNDRTSDGEVIKLNNIKIEVIRTLKPEHFVYLKGEKRYVK